MSWTVIVVASIALLIGVAVGITIAIIVPWSARRAATAAGLRQCRTCGARDWQGSEACFACGTPFLRQSEAAPMSAPDLMIVSRDRGDLYDLVRRTGKNNLEIHLDRRLRERRRVPKESFGEERRQPPDRRQMDITVELGLLGWALLPAAKRKR